jgi:DNA-binding protein HU-beta
MSKQFEEVSYHEVLSNVAEKTGASKKDTYAFYKAFRETIAEELYGGRSVKLPSLVTFELVEQGPRESRSPATGEPVHVPAKVVVKARRKKLLNDVPEHVKPQNH